MRQPLAAGADGMLAGAVAPRAGVWRRFGRIVGGSKQGLTGGVIVLIMTAVALLAPFISRYEPNTFDTKARFEPPSAAHWFGTDSNGRDVYSRIVYGARISVLIGVVAVGFAALLGVPLGIVAGYKRGMLDDVIMRIMDAMFAFPPIVLAIALVAVLGPSLRNLMLAIGIVYIPTFARQSRAPALSERERDYVVAARVMGATDLRIMFRHVAPNTMASVIVRATISIAYAILAEASLSFLGLGVPPPTPAWGRMLNEARQFLEVNFWLAVFPGIAIFLIVLAFNLLGDGLRDVLDPKLRGS